MDKYLLKIVYTFIILIFACTLTGFDGLPQNTTDVDDEISVNITQIDTSAFPLVTVYISVLDKNGEPYGIDPGMLAIEENGKEITLDQIEGFGDVGSLSTLLVMDVSGSMNAGGKLESSKRVAMDYINQMRPGDQAGIIAFNTDIAYVQPITKSMEELITAINNLTAKNDTALYDAIFEATKILESITGRKAIIALTDGLDNQSINNPNDIIENIGPGGLSISTIGLGVPGQGSGALSALDEEVLLELAENAGGRYGYAEDEDGLRNIYELYGRSLQSEYVITYLSPSDLRDGVNRQINVKLKSSNIVNESGYSESKYNPGGLIPEVSNPAPWSVFVIALTVLFTMFYLPILLNNLKITNKTGKIRLPNKKNKSRIKLK